MSYKRILELAEIGAKRELEEALINFQITLIKSETEVVPYETLDKAQDIADKASSEYVELKRLIKALESF